MSQYSIAYNYPFDLQGTIIRTISLLGITDFGTGRINNMPNAIEFNKGDSKMIRIWVKDENLDIINLNGAEARFYLAPSSKSTSYIFKKSTADYKQGVIKTPEKGEIVFFLNTDDTKELEPDQYYYQVSVTLKNGTRYTVSSGRFNLRVNLEFTEGGDTPTPEEESFLVNVAANSYSIKIGINSHEIIMPSLVAPDENAPQIWITNVVYTEGFATVYFSTQITTEGWKLAYTISLV